HPTTLHRPTTSSLFPYTTLFRSIIFLIKVRSMQQFLISLFFLLLPLTSAFAIELDIIYQSPQPGAKYCTREETIILSVFEKIESSSLDSTLISVTGSISATHTGMLFLSSDAETIIFKPDNPCLYSERINVIIHRGMRTTRGEIIQGRTLSFSIRDEFISDNTFVYSTDRTSTPHKGMEYNLFPQNYSRGINSSVTITNSTNPSYGKIFISGF